MLECTKHRGCQKVVCTHYRLTFEIQVSIIKMACQKSYLTIWFLNLHLTVTGGALAEGFQARLQEFQNFEQIFEVGIL